VIWGIGGVALNKQIAILYRIALLARNDCCHSGSNFDAAKLGLLIHYIFELPTLASIEVYDDITSRP
jgi:hypothetical protein